MAQNTENFNKELYELLKVRGHKPVPLNSKNQRVNASQEADVIEFTFTKDGEEYGKAWISIENSNSIKIYYDSEQQESPSDPTPGMDYDDTWTGLLKHLKQWALRRQLGFDLANKDRLGDDMKQRDYYRMKEKVAESKNRSLTENATYGEASKLIDFAEKHIKDKNHPVFAAIDELIDSINDNRTINHSLEKIKKMLSPLMESYHTVNKRTSYNDAVPNVKVILQHSRNLEEGEARFRNVAKIFLENVDGERFLAPTTKPGLARVYARHIAEGGLPNDERWNHIKTMCEEFAKLGSFVRATRNKEFNESAAELVNEGVNYYQNIKESLRKMTTHRGYHSYFENYTPTLMEDDIDESIASLFVQENIDPRIESVMPILAKLRKVTSEAKEVGELAQWADDVINEKLELDEIGDTLKGKKVLGAYVNDAADEIARDVAWAGSMHRAKKDTKYDQRKQGIVRAVDRLVGKNNLDESKDNLEKDLARLASAAKPSVVSKFIGKTEDFDKVLKDILRKYGNLPTPNYEKMSANFKVGKVSPTLAHHIEQYAYGVRNGPGYGKYDKRNPKWELNIILGKAPVTEEKIDEAVNHEKKIEAINKKIKDYEGKLSLARERRKKAAGHKKGVQGTAEVNISSKLEQLRKELDTHERSLKGSTNEGLDKNQKKAGQLGPTEKITKKNPLKGKLVGANESTELNQITKLAGIKK